MPYLETQEHENLLAFQENNKILTKEINQTKAQKRKAIVLSIIFACLFLLTLALLAFYMFKYTNNYVKIEDSQQLIESDSLQNYQTKIAHLQEELNAVNMQNSIANKIVYAVQIGAFKESNMSLFSSNLVNFKEINTNDYNKYALGNFETLPEAQKFRKQLVKLGFKDAFIASFKNNERLKIEEAY